MRFPTIGRVFLMISISSVSVACNDDATAPDPSGPVTIAIAQSLTGQTTSAGAFRMTGARADSGATTEELTFGGPLTQSPVPLTYVRTRAGKQGTITGAANFGATPPTGTLTYAARLDR